MHGDLDLIIKLIELIALVGGGGVFIFKMGRVVSKFEEVGKKQSSDIDELKKDMKVMVEVLTKQALQGERITALSARLTLIDKQIDELRHGEGFVYPLGSHLSKP